MKFKIKLNYLKKLKNLTYISPPSILKNLENILIIVKDYHLIAYSTDGITNAKLKLAEDNNLRIIEEGRMLINTKILSSLIDSLKNEDVEIFKTEKEIFRLKNGEFSCDLKTIIDNNFPIPDFDINDYKKITLPISLLIKINKRFKDFTQQTNDISKTNLTIINGINIKTNNVDNNIDVCSTDSYKAVYGNFKYHGPTFNFTIVPSTLNNIISFFRNPNQDIDLYISDLNIILKTENFILKSRLINGNYPSILEWLNTIPEVQFNVNKNELLEALDRTSLLISFSSRTITFSVKKNKLLIEYNDGDKGSSKETINIENLTNNDIEIGVDSLFLKSLIKNIEDEIIQFNLTTPLKPIVIKGLEKDIEFKQLMLPTRSY